jgi:hypothetical protein
LNFFSDTLTPAYRGDEMFAISGITAKAKTKTKAWLVECMHPTHRDGWGSRAALLERKAVVLRTMPTSQNRDMGHPARF